MHEDDFLEMAYEDRVGHFDDPAEEFEEEPEVWCDLHDEPHLAGGLLCEFKSQEAYYR